MIDKMRFVTVLTIVIASSPFVAANAQTSATPVASAPASKMPHVQVDVARRQIRVDCEALNVDIPLEFFCVTAGGNEHESVLRTPARPSHIHLALLLLGLQPGEPVKYSEAAQKWFPPHGPPLHLSVEYQKNGKTVHLPANELMRSVKTKQMMPPFTWIFAGSRVLDDGTYGADPTGYVVSICNFDLCLIDVPALVSSANETLEWERNPDTVPPTGTPVTMIIEPAGNAALAATPAATQSTVTTTTPLTTVVKVSGQDHIELDGRSVALEDLPSQLSKMKQKGSINARLATAPDTNPEFVTRVVDAFGVADVQVNRTDAGATTQLSDVHIDQNKIDRVRERWKQAVKPHAAALQEASQAQYEVLTEFRREQQRLIDEADRIQRMIDELDKEYQDMTTPRPEPVTPTTSPTIP